MGLISNAIETIGGSWLKIAALPVAFTAAVVGWHQFVKTREALQNERETRLIERGRQQCISAVDLALARAERDAAIEREKLVKDEAAAAQQASEEVRTNADRIAQELAAIRSAPDRSDADRCLSPGVLERLGRVESGSRKGR